MRIFDDKDIAAVQASVSQVIKDAIGQLGNVAASVVIPATVKAVREGIAGVTVTVGPITIEPIKIQLEVEPPER